MILFLKGGVVMKRIMKHFRKNAIILVGILVGMTVVLVSKKK